MRKFLTKGKMQLLILAVALIGIITIAGNISLAVNKKVINSEINRYFKHNISVGPALYFFPNRIIFKDIVIDNTETPHDHSSFGLSKMVVHYSFLDFFIGGALRVSNVTLFPSTIDYYALSQFLEDNFQEILEIIRNSPDNDIKIRIKETLLDVGRNEEPEYIATELLLAVRGDFINGTGLFRADQYETSDRDSGEVHRTTKGWPLWYKVQGELKPDGLTIDHLILKSENYYSKLWGGVRSGSAKVNGFMFADTTKKTAKEVDFSLARYLNNFPTDNEMSNIDVYILDIDAQVVFLFPKITINQFYFTMNNNPVTIKGDVSLLDPLTVNAQLAIQQPHTMATKDTLFEQVDMSFSGTWKDDTLNTNGKVDISFFENENFNFSPEDAQITFSDFRFTIDQPDQIAVNLSDGALVYRINNIEHKFSIQDFEAVAKAKTKGLKVIEMSAPFYNGVLDGIVEVDSAQTPSTITSHLTLNNVDTDAMEELLTHFAKFDGRMSSAMNFTNDPAVDLSGDITIFDGTMTNFDFFNWVGDTFRLPALKSIDFDRASAQFSINKEHIQLRNISLRTEDVRIGGYFDVNYKNLVSSDITLSLSQELLRRSPKFKPILKIFEKDDSHLDFDFQLSGSLDAVNFRWLPSPDKEKIQIRIPDFIERSIEKNIDQMLETDLQEAD